MLYSSSTCVIVYLIMLLTKTVSKVFSVLYKHCSTFGRSVGVSEVDSAGVCVCVGL